MSRFDYVEVTRLTLSSVRVERICRTEKPDRMPVWYARSDSRRPRKGDVLEVYAEGGYHSEVWAVAP